MTNDGELTDLLTHPRYGVEKTYLAQVAGVPTPESLAKLERGVHLAEGFAHAERVTVRHSHRHSTLLEIVLAEGRNREVRRLLARLGTRFCRCGELPWDRYVWASCSRARRGHCEMRKLKNCIRRRAAAEEIEPACRAAQNG